MRVQRAANNRRKGAGSRGGKILRNIQIQKEHRELWEKFLKHMEDRENGVDKEDKESKVKSPEKPTKAINRAKRAKKGQKSAPEGVVAAPAPRSPGASTAERAPAAPPPPLPTAAAAPAKRAARRLPIPKGLVIDMVDDLAATEATGRGQRTRKPRKIFEEEAVPSKGKRKRAAAAEEDAPAPPAIQKADNNSRRLDCPRYLYRHCSAIKFRTKCRFTPRLALNAATSAKGQEQAQACCCREGSQHSPAPNQETGEKPGHFDRSISWGLCCCSSSVHNACNQPGGFCCSFAC